MALELVDKWVWGLFYGDFHALITARVNHGPPDGCGAIGHARSDDLIRWDVLPPLAEPGDFGHMEVPQLTEINGRYYLLLCAGANVHSGRRRQRTSLEPATGTHYMVADHPLGPFRCATELSDPFPVEVDRAGTLAVDWRGRRA
jgi:beta-fructofuranosidase